MSHTASTVGYWHPPGKGTLDGLLVSAAAVLWVAVGGKSATKSPRNKVKREVKKSLRPGLQVCRAYPRPLGFRAIWSPRVHVLLGLTLAKFHVLMDAATHISTQS